MAGLDDDAPDDARDDDVPGGPRPDPGDRPWVHPAELQAFRAVPASDPNPPRPREWAIGLLSGLAGAAAAVLLLVAFGALGGRERAAVPPPLVTTPNSPVDYAVAQRVAASAAPSVVTVAVARPDGSALTGSGMIVRTERVLTSAHLVNGASEVKVTTKAGDDVVAQVVGTDATTDVALLAVADVDASLPELERVDEPEIADAVVAVASARGNTPWASIGVLEEHNVLTANGAVPLVGLFATSIATTDFTTGGGLFDTDGRVVGILTSAPGAARAGLALPIDVALDVADQLERSKAAAHGAIGVVFGTDRPGGAGGAVLLSVLPEGASAKADPPLRAGDVIVRAGEQDVNGMQDVVAAARRRQPTEPLEVVFERGGRMQRTVVQLDPAPDSLWTEYGAIG